MSEQRIINAIESLIQTVTAMTLADLTVEFGRPGAVEILRQAIVDAEYVVQNQSPPDLLAKAQREAEKK